MSFIHPLNCVVEVDDVDPCCSVTFTGFCLEDGTPIGIVVQEEEQIGWFNFLTGVFTPGSPPAGTHVCPHELEKGETAAVTSVASAVVSTSLLAANPLRHSFHIFNDSTSSLFVKFGLAASLTSFTIKITSNGYKEFIYPPYIGDVTGIWQAADGFARVTEVLV